jgi:SAM-dependent methyltransferase
MRMFDYKGAIQSFLDKELRDKEKIYILEAGCGSLSKITVKQTKHITGIDISEKQLERNRMLDMKIKGDLHTHNLGSNQYDLIVCWDVLEHLEKPGMALDNMVKSLKPGGILLIKLPNLMSLKGLITKYSSHSIHVLYYKIVFKQKNAGKDDTGPFKTYLKYAVSPGGLKKYVRERNLEMPYFRFHDVLDDSFFLDRLKYRNQLRALYSFARNAARILSFGRLNGSELAMVIRKPVIKKLEARHPGIPAAGLEV